MKDLTPGQLIALDQFLNDWPHDMTFDEILKDIINEKTEEKTIIRHLYCDISPEEIFMEINCLAKQIDKEINKDVAEKLRNISVGDQLMLKGTFKEFFKVAAEIITNYTEEGKGNDSF